MLVECQPLESFKEYIYTVIFARQADKHGKWQWLYARQKDRDTYETAGGKIEPGESPLDCAKRELYEETGAVDFNIFPAFDYNVNNNSAGQVFMAEVESLESIPADSEMAEVKSFATFPDKMTYPAILPVLYEEMQAWIARNTPEEYWDLLDENRQPIGKTHRRGEPLLPGTYHLVVRAWLVNSQGEFLITRRSLTKLGGPGIWEVTAGSAGVGEDSLTAAVREVFEESGIKVKPESGEKFYSKRERTAFWDIWLFRCEFDLADVVLQEGETMDAKKASLTEIETMLKAGCFLSSVVEPEIELLRGII